ncbi:hypothetical protein GCM10023143_16720 [Compostibacter hankyongensis]|uniref:TonB-dependent receptor n=2 Tax=Compostibacter hankyongensis TaxID=1007089 RepID=A0ABP8FQJ5_9BACT
MIALAGSAAAQDGKRMDSSIFRLGDVVITGQYSPRSMKQSVFRVRSISAERIRLSGAVNLQQVLMSQPGIRFSSDNTLGTSDIELMGMSGQNVKILLDGVPLTDRGDTRESLNQVDIHTIDHIEIVEGPLSVTYGTDALAGVINIITRKDAPGDNLFVSAGIQEESAGSEYHPFAKEGLHNEHLRIGWQHKGWSLSGYGTRNDFGGWKGHAAGREKEWKPKDQGMAGVTAGYSHNNMDIRYRLDYLDEGIFSPGRLNPNNYKALDQHYLTTRVTQLLQAEWRISPRISYSGAASYQVDNRRTRSIGRDFRSGKDSLTTGAGEQDRSVFHTLFFRSTVQYRISSAISLQPGMEIKSDHADDDRITGAPTLNDYALFVSSEISIPAGIRIRPGIRLTKNSVYKAPPLIPSLSAKFALARDLDLRLSYARGFRAPSLRELYFTFFDANHSIQGNPGLKAEQSNSFNGALSWQVINRDDLRFGTELTAFYNGIDNHIDLALGADNIYTYMNIFRYRTTGGVLEGSLLWKHLQATLAFSCIGRYNELSEDKQQSLPAFVWSPELSSGLTWHLPKAGASLALYYKYTGSLPAYEADPDHAGKVHLARTAAFHWADLTATKTLAKHFTLQAGVKNLFNVTRLPNTTLNTEGAHSTGSLQPMSYGRSWFIGASFSWSKH